MPKFTLEDVRRLIDLRTAPWRTRVRNMITRAQLSALDSGSGIARGTFALTADDTADGVEVLQPVGLSSRPAPNAEAVVFAINGNPANLVALTFVRGQRLRAGKLAGEAVEASEIEEGETALYIGNAGQKVHLRNDGSVEVQAAEVSGSSVVLKANGDVVITPGAGGKIYAGADGAPDAVALGPAVKARLDALKAAFNSWVPAPNDGGAALKAVLSAPGGWLAGSNAVAATKVNAS